MNSVKEPEEAGFFGSSPRETNLYINTQIKLQLILDDLVACGVNIQNENQISSRNMNGKQINQK